MTEKTVGELAALVGGQVVGDGEARITSGATLELARPGQITFLANARYALLVPQTRASAVVVPEPMECPAAQIITGNPYYAFTRILVLLHGHRRHLRVGISPQANVHPTATVGPDVSLHPNVTVGEEARIGRGSILYPGVFIGPGTEVGEDCVLLPHVVVYENCQIGNRVIIHAGACVGHDGLGFSTHQGVHHKIPHIARAVIEDDVEIGSNAGIERGSLHDTVIGTGSKIGSAVAIGHGVRIGAHCLMVAQTGVAGSTRIGHHCVMAGQVGIAGHLEIGNHVTMAAQSGVSQNIPDGERVFGTPAFEMSKAVESAAIYKRLPELRRTLRELEQRVAELEKRAGPGTAG